MKKRLITMFCTLSIVFSMNFCNGGQTEAYSEETTKNAEYTDTSLTGTTKSNESEFESEANTDAARSEIMEQRMKRREFEEEDQRQVKSVSKTKTFKCYYCKNKFYEDGVHDKCMLVKDVNGNRIETGVELLLNIPPAFCSQACYDRFHEYKHDGHDVIF